MIARNAEAASPSFPDEGRACQRAKAKPHINTIASKILFMEIRP